MSDIKPAKLDRLKANLKKEDLDDNLRNYYLLGSRAHSTQEDDNRLINHIAANVINPYDLPLTTNRCKCFQTIEHNCFIQHKLEKYIIKVGRCCYKGLTLLNDRKLQCPLLHCKNVHQNKKTMYCNEHRYDVVKFEELGKQRFHFGKRYYGLNIHEIPKSYVDWINENDVCNFRIKDLLEYHRLKNLLYPELKSN